MTCAASNQFSLIVSLLHFVYKVLKVEVYNQLIDLEENLPEKKLSCSCLIHSDKASVTVSALFNSHLNSLPLIKIIFTAPGLQRYLTFISVCVNSFHLCFIDFYHICVEYNFFVR